MYNTRDSSNGFVENYETERNNLEGYLIKQGIKVKSWKRRWFTQKDDRLYYYKVNKTFSDEKNDGKRIAMGFVDLKGATLKIVNDRAFSFSILTPLRIWYLKCENEDEYDYWINGIKNIQQIYNNKLTTSKSSFTKEIELQKEFEKFTVDIFELKEKLLHKEKKIDKLNEKIKSLLQIIKSKDIQLDQKFFPVSPQSQNQGSHLSVNLSPSDSTLPSGNIKEVKIESSNENSTPSSSNEETSIKITEIKNATNTDIRNNKDSQINVEDESDVESLKRIIAHLQKENSYLHNKLFSSSKSTAMVDLKDSSSDPESSLPKENELPFNSDTEVHTNNSSAQFFKILEDD